MSCPWPTCLTCLRCLPEERAEEGIRKSLAAMKEHPVLLQERWAADLSPLIIQTVLSGLGSGVPLKLDGVLFAALLDIIEEEKATPIALYSALDALYNLLASAQARPTLLKMPRLIESLKSLLYAPYVTVRGNVIRVISVLALKCGLPACSTLCQPSTIRLVLQRCCPTVKEIQSELTDGPKAALQRPLASTRKLVSFYHVCTFSNSLAEETRAATVNYFLAMALMRAGDPSELVQFFLDLDDLDEIVAYLCERGQMEWYQYGGRALVTARHVGVFLLVLLRPEQHPREPTMQRLLIRQQILNHLHFIHPFVLTVLMGSAQGLHDQMRKKKAEDRDAGEVAATCNVMINLVEALSHESECCSYLLPEGLIESHFTELLQLWEKRNQAVIRGFPGAHNAPANCFWEVIFEKYFYTTEDFTELLPTQGVTLMPTLHCTSIVRARLLRFAGEKFRVEDAKMAILDLSRRVEQSLAMMQVHSSSSFDENPKILSNRQFESYGRAALSAIQERYALRETLEEAPNQTDLSDESRAIYWLARGWVRYWMVCHSKPHYREIALVLLDKALLKSSFLSENQKTEMETCKAILLRMLCIQCRQELTKEDHAVGRKLMRCGRCRQVCYCHQDCQIAHWPIHKAVCT